MLRRLSSSPASGTLTSQGLRSLSKEERLYNTGQIEPTEESTYIQYMQTIATAGETSQEPVVRTRSALG